MTEPLAEQHRLQRLHDTGILDTKGDHLFRCLADQALEILPGTSFAAIGLIDAERHWFKTFVGLDVREVPRAVSFCSHTIQTAGVMIVEDLAADQRFASNPFVTGGPKIRFYAGVSLVDSIGAICVMGRAPRHASPAEITKLKKLAQYVDIQLLAHGALFNLTRDPPPADRPATQNPETN